MYLFARDGAYAQLKDKAKGSFLVRESESYPGSYALQIKLVLISNSYIMYTVYTAYTVYCAYTYLQS